MNLMFIILIPSLVVGLLVALPVFSESQPELKTFLTHSGAVIRTSGDIIDPIYLESTVEFDPMEYLRTFHYGNVSELPDGTALREFTIIAEDDKIMEILPGVFYNVWTFNGNCPRTYHSGYRGRYAANHLH